MQLLKPAILACWALPLLAQAPPKDLTQVSLEDLMNVQVTSVSKKEQSLSKTGAAAFVITQEDIRRSGASTIPELLRMVPGVNVARVNAHTWSISIRGFSDLYGDKVLVMIDGRPLYRQTFSGVNWDEVDLPLENIERIEVIRGPGGTVWGANAVNGVINIISKTAAATQGGLISTTVGSELLPDTTAQYGGSAGTRGAYRVYGRFFNTLRSGSTGSQGSQDPSRTAHVGFRLDRDVSVRDSLTINGDAMDVHGTEPYATAQLGSSDTNATTTLPIRYLSGAITASWKHMLANGGQISLQFYDDYYVRVFHALTESRNTIDFDFEHHLKLGKRHDLVWGLGYRRTSDQFGIAATTFNPAHVAEGLYSGFIQDEIRLADSLAFTLGAKFEDNAYTGYEDEPSAQLVWTPSERQTVWASAGRAVRQPSRLDRDFTLDLPNYPFPGGPIGEITLSGNPHPKAEQLSAAELGYRATIGRRFSLDISGFANYYRHLRTQEALTPSFVLTPGPPHLLVPNIYDYKAHAHSYGSEVSANWTPVERWRLTAGYALLHIRVGLAPSSNDTNQAQIAASSPTHRVELGSFYNLSRNLELDGRVSYTGMLKNGPIPGFPSMNLRIGWRPSERTEFSLAGQNLLQRQHAEFPDEVGLLHSLVERSITAKFTWRF
jgi:iron complex outermembrane receptor protein